MDVCVHASAYTGCSCSRLESMLVNILLSLCLSHTLLYPARQIYLYDEGLARLATEQYQAPTGANLHVNNMHLTNYSINKVRSCVSLVKAGRKVLDIRYVFQSW